MVALFTFSEPITPDDLEISGKFADEVLSTSMENALLFTASLDPVAGITLNVFSVKIRSEIGSPASPPCLMSAFCIDCDLGKMTIHKIYFNM